MWLSYNGKKCDITIHKQDMKDIDFSGQAIILDIRYGESYNNTTIEKIYGKTQNEIEGLLKDINDNNFSKDIFLSAVTNNDSSFDTKIIEKLIYNISHYFPELTKQDFDNKYLEFKRIINTD